MKICFFFEAKMAKEVPDSEMRGFFHVSLTRATVKESSVAGRLLVGQEIALGFRKL